MALDPKDMLPLMKAFDVDPFLCSRAAFWDSKGEMQSAIRVVGACTSLTHQQGEISWLSKSAPAPDQHSLHMASQSFSSINSIVFSIAVRESLEKRMDGWIEYDRIAKGGLNTVTKVCSLRQGRLPWPPHCGE
jgi:hypothetical protein